MTGGPPNAELTPVRIRGKRRPFPTESAPTNAVSKIGRNAAYGSRKKTAKIIRRQKNLLAPIEQLPKEILDLIFSFTVNPNFPRASLVLGRILSNQSLLDFHYRRIFRAFISGVTTTGIEQDYFVVGPFVERHYAPMRAARTTTLQITRSTADYLIPLCQKLLAEEKERIRHLYMQGTEKSAIPRPFWVFEEELPFNIDGASNLDALLHSLQLSFKDCGIPSKLLQYPLNAYSRKLLWFLARSGCLINWMNSFDGEMARDAWGSAVRAKDYRAVHLFMGRGIKVRPSQNELEAALDAINWDAAMFRLIAIASIKLASSYYREVSPYQFKDYDDFNLYDLASHLQLSESGTDYEGAKEAYPDVWIKALAKNPEGSVGRSIINEASNNQLVEIINQQPLS